MKAFSTRFANAVRSPTQYVIGQKFLAIKDVPIKKSSVLISTSKTHQGVSDKFPGFSKEVIQPNCDDVGPGAMKEGSYQNPEYFCYNEFSYYELHILLRTFRIPQPSSLSKQNQEKMDKRKNKSKKC